MKIEEEAINQGIRGFFYVNDPIDKFIKGVCALFRAELWAPRKVMSECILKNNKNNNHAKPTINLLTEREVEIVRMLVAGFSSPTIAEKLYISPHTVKTHLYNIYKKINVPNRLQATLWATKHWDEMQ